MIRRDRRFRKHVCQTWSCVNCTVCVYFTDTHTHTPVMFHMESFRPQTRALTASSPHHFIMVTIIGVINWSNYRAVTEALLSTQGNTAASFSTVRPKTHYFGLDLLHPLNPRALLPAANTFLSPLSGCRGHSV